MHEERPKTRVYLYVAVVVIGVVAAVFVIDFMGQAREQEASVTTTNVRTLSDKSSGIVADIKSRIPEFFSEDIPTISEIYGYPL